MEWASTCEQLQMLQCQHVWPQAKHFVVMGREMDWTMHSPELWCRMLRMCVRHELALPDFAAFLVICLFQQHLQGQSAAVNYENFTGFI